MASGQLFASEQYYATFLYLLHKKLTKVALLHQDSVPTYVSCHCGNSPLALYLLITHHILHVGLHWTLDLFPDLTKYCAGAHFTADCRVGCCRGTLKHARRDILPGHDTAAIMGIVLC